MWRCSPSPSWLWKCWLTFRSSVSNILTEFRQSRFCNEQKQRHDIGLALKERLLGSNVLNPAEVVRMYLEDSSVCDQSAELIAAASDSSLIPTGKQMKKFANNCQQKLQQECPTRRP